MFSAFQDHGVIPWLVEESGIEPLTRSLASIDTVKRMSRCLASL